MMNSGVTFVKNHFHNILLKYKEFVIPIRHQNVAYFHSIQSAPFVVISKMEYRLFYYTIGITVNAYVVRD